MTVVQDQTLAQKQALARLTPKQRRTLARLDCAPWKWFTTDARYFALRDRYEREAQHRYFATLNRCTTYTGPDYRIRLHGQSTWIRANRWQYEQAAELGIPRTIWEPEPLLVVA